MGLRGQVLLERASMGCRGFDAPGVITSIEMYSFNRITDSSGELVGIG